MRKVIEEAVWNTYGGMKTPAGLVGQVNRKDVYEYADGSLAVEEDHAYLRKLTEAELKEWEGK